MRYFHKELRHFELFLKALSDSKFSSQKFFIPFYKSYRYGLGDIALDDIVVSNSCPPDDRLCTFEDPSICNYVNDAVTQYNWTRTTGANQIISASKPLIDHTDGTSNGAYMIVDISQSSTTTINQRARLLSPVINPNGEQCVEFWYYFDAETLSTASKLSVFVRTNPHMSNESNYLIWSKNIHQVSCFFWIANGKKSNAHCSRKVNGVFLNNVFHMVLV